MLFKCSANTKTVLSRLDASLQIFHLKKFGGEGEALGKHSEEILVIRPFHACFLFVK